MRQTVDVSEVDPKDDAIERWLVMELRYDPDRRERRNVVIAPSTRRTNATVDSSNSGAKVETQI